MTSIRPVPPAVPQASKKQKCLKCFKHFVHFKRHLKKSAKCAAAYASIPTLISNRQPTISTAVPREPATRPVVAAPEPIQSMALIREPECIRNRQCRWCGGVNEFFSTIRETKRHYKQVHPNTCIECGLKCRDEKERSLHERDEHQLQYSLDDEIEPHPAVLSVPTSINAAPSARPLSQSPSFNLPSSMDELVESTAVLDSENVPPSSSPPPLRLNATVLPPVARIQTVPCKQSIQVKKCNVLNKSLPTFKNAPLLNLSAEMVDIESCSALETVQTLSASVDDARAVCKNHTTSYTSARFTVPQILNAPLSDITPQAETEEVSEMEPFELKPVIPEVLAEPSRSRASVKQKLMMFKASRLEKKEKGPDFQTIEMLVQCSDMPFEIAPEVSVVEKLPIPKVITEQPEVRVFQKQEKGPELKTIEMLETCDHVCSPLTAKTSLTAASTKYNVIVNEQPVVKLAKVTETKIVHKEQSKVKAVKVSEPKIVGGKSTARTDKTAKVLEQKAVKCPELEVAKNPELLVATAPEAEIVEVSESKASKILKHAIKVPERTSAKVSKHKVAEVGEPKVSKVTSNTEGAKARKPDAVNALEPKIAKAVEPKVAKAPEPNVTRISEPNVGSDKPEVKVPKVRLDFSALRAAQKNLSAQKSAGSLVAVTVPLPTSESDKGAKVSSMQGRARKTVPKKKQHSDGSSSTTVDSSSSSTHDEIQSKRKRKKDERESSSSGELTSTKKTKLDSRSSEPVKKVSREIEVERPDRQRSISSSPESERCREVEAEKPESQPCSSSADSTKKSCESEIENSASHTPCSSSTNSKNRSETDIEKPARHSPSSSSAESKRRRETEMEKLTGQSPIISSAEQKRTHEDKVEKSSSQWASSAELNTSTFLHEPLSNTFSFEPKKRVQHSRRETVTVSANTQIKTNSESKSQKTSPVKYFFNADKTKPASETSQRGTSIPPPKVAKLSAEISKQKSSDKESRTKQYHCAALSGNLQKSPGSTETRKGKTLTFRTLPTVASQFCTLSMNIFCKCSSKL